MTINRRTIKNWWRSLKVKPVSPGLERVSIVFTIVFALVSTFIAFMTFIQQQKIEGMNDLLLKQDVITKQNLDMISRLESTQNYIIEQINAIKSQTESTEYSSKPILDVIGYVSIIFDVNTKKLKIVLEVKNYGLRPASMIRFKGAWLKLDNNILTSWLELTPTRSPESLLPNQKLTISKLKEFTNSELNEFATLFFALDLQYYDPLTNKTEKVKIFRRHIKDSSAGLEQRFSLGYVSEPELSQLRKFRLGDW